MIKGKEKCLRKKKFQGRDIVVCITCHKKNSRLLFLSEFRCCLQNSNRKDEKLAINCRHSKLVYLFYRKIEFRVCFDFEENKISKCCTDFRFQTNISSQLSHLIWIMDNGHVIRAFFKNIPNNWPIRAYGPNKFWGIWGISS